MVKKRFHQERNGTLCLNAPSPMKGLENIGTGHRPPVTLEDSAWGTAVHHVSECMQERIGDKEESKHRDIFLKKKSLKKQQGWLEQKWGTEEVGTDTSRWQRK